jgi:hypothetical protein
MRLLSAAVAGVQNGQLCSADHVNSADSVFCDIGCLLRSDGTCLVFVAPLESSHPAISLFPDQERRPRSIFHEGPVIAVFVWIDTSLTCFKPGLRTFMSCPSPLCVPFCVPFYQEVSFQHPLCTRRTQGPRVESSFYVNYYREWLPHYRAFGQSLSPRSPLSLRRMSQILQEK